MAVKKCRKASEDCPLYYRQPPPNLKSSQEHGCFSDLDHIVPRRLGTTALAKTYINLPENKQQLCRAEHDQKTAEGDEPLPSREYMLGRVAAAVEAGAAYLSKRKAANLGIKV